jgi:hypothetical protein
MLVLRFAGFEIPGLKPGTFFYVIFRGLKASAPSVVPQGLKPGILFWRFAGIGMQNGEMRFWSGGGDMKEEDLGSGVRRV